MAEYIEREATYEDFEKCNSENPKWTPSRVKALIARQKAADVDPVRHGRWVNEDFPDEQADATDPAICSECKEPAHKAEHGYAILSKYCHNCGAKMDGGPGNGCIHKQRSGD